jgi:hypothetical protein
MPEEWIGEVRFSPAVETKLRERRGLTPPQIREAVCWGAAEEAVWDDDEEYGSRLLVVGTTADGVRIKAVLSPVDREDGTWTCKTAMRAGR